MILIVATRIAAAKLVESQADFDNALAGVTLAQLQRTQAEKYSFFLSEKKRKIFLPAAAQESQP